MTDDVKTGPLPGVSGGPSQPGGGAADAGQPGSGGEQPVPNPSGIPGRSGASEGADKSDLAPGPDQALDDIKKGAR